METANDPPAQPFAQPLAQGARSFVEPAAVGGRPCVKKTFTDDKYGSAAAKWRRETAFYRAYGGIDVLPRLYDRGEDEYIVVSREKGVRHIDAVRSGELQADNAAVSYSYGQHAAKFLRHTSRVGECADAGVPAYGIDDIGRAGFAALEENPAYRLPELVRTLERLAGYAGAGGAWDTPMLSKSDWSSANMLVEGEAVSCIFDFDTAYRSTRLGFVGNIINSCLHLRWGEVRRGMAEDGTALPEVEDQIVAAQASMWLKVVPRQGGDGLIRWPPPDELLGKLRDLERQCAKD